MTKKPSKRKAVADPSPGHAAEEASRMVRLDVDDPGKALADAVGDRMKWAEVSAAWAELQELTPDAFASQPPELVTQVRSAMRFVPHLIQRRIDALKAGQLEAEAIRSHLDRYEVGNLRAYLKEYPASPECLVWLLAENRRLAQALAVSEAASKAARLKNQAARDFVAQAWAARADAEQSKASFARMVQHEVKRRFGVTVTADRIARYWLP